MINIILIIGFSRKKFFDCTIQISKDSANNCEYGKKLIDEFLISLIYINKKFKI